jgi:hypothetical protein
MQTTYLPVEVKGHIKIIDDLGTVLLDKTNAVHPQNVARVIARALSNETNYCINRIAFGNGGTIVNAAFDVTYRSPNDGQSPDMSGWASRLYHETYSEIINAGQTVLNPLLGQDLGSADSNVGVRTGGGAVPSGDPAPVTHVSGPGVRSSELGLISEVVIYSVLNGAEPTSQSLLDSNAHSNITTTAGEFVFDEIGLYTSGAQAIDTSGYQYISVGNRTSTDDTTLLLNTTYSFNIAADGGTSVIISFTTPSSGSGPSGQYLYGDLCQQINMLGLPGGAHMSITDLTNGTFPTIAGASTYGFLRVESNTTGTASTVNLAGAQTTAFLVALNLPLGAILITPNNFGTAAGVQNAPTAPTTERERLLTHLIFSPVLKSANRTLSVTYTLTISVARTV